MKLTQLILISFFYSFLTSCGQMERTPANEIKNQYTRHIVLDIDWTLVAEIKNPSERIKKLDRVVEVEGKYYFVNEGVEEFIESVLRKKDVSLSFYSGGSESRNRLLLKKIKISDGRSLGDIAYKILNKEDLITVPGAIPSAPFSDRYKKDLTKISNNLEELIMLDDNSNFVFEHNVPQRKNLFFLGTSFEFFETYNDSKLFLGKYIPKSYDEWLLDRRKFFIMSHAFNVAYEASLYGNMSFSEAMKLEEKKLDLASSKWNDFSKSYYQKNFLKSEVNCHDSARLIILGL
ncbi:MAG: HAD family hydrolase [Bdellovibrionales bacterium]|nr:HAD family hydrolase [Bdellovibrionales bacterium]